MIHEISKISKMVEIILNYYLSNSAKNINFTVREELDKYIIDVRGDIKDCDKEQLYDLKRLLNVQRQREMEEYYWQLSPNSKELGQINLVGMMTDEAIIEYNFSILKIKLVRFK